MIWGASVIGREHVRLGKNNQDAWAFVEREGACAVVVTDGCSSERGSEVGAQLAARWLATWAAREAVGLGNGAAFVQSASNALVEWLSKVASAIGVERVVETNLLFTFLCAVRVGGRLVVFGAGDGAVWVDGSLMRFDSGPDNAPAYIAYRLQGGASEARAHFDGVGERVALMTDGFEAVDELALSQLIEGLGANPLALQRRLNLLSEANRLADDATIAVMS